MTADAWKPTRPTDAEVERAIRAACRELGEFYDDVTGGVPLLRARWYAIMALAAWYPPQQGDDQIRLAELVCYPGNKRAFYGNARLSFDLRSPEDIRDENFIRCMDWIDERTFARVIDAVRPGETPPPPPDMPGDRTRCRSRPMAPPPTLPKARWEQVAPPNRQHSPTAPVKKNSRPPLTKEEWGGGLTIRRAPAVDALDVTAAQMGDPPQHRSAAAGARPWQPYEKIAPDDSRRVSVRRRERGGERWAAEEDG